jgi:hypothetical protein
MDTPSTLPTSGQLAAHETAETNEMPEWHNLWWCIRNVPGDLCRYLYFMRFSLLLWLFLPTLALLDINPDIASITRGILTPSDWVQWILAGFTVVLPGWFALLAARIVCSYGPERFGSPVPPCFIVYDKMETFVFFGAQLPGLVLLYRIAFNIVHEGEGNRPLAIASLFCGALLALAFWHIIAILYYWSYDPSNLDRARAFLVPKWLWLPLDEIKQLPPAGLLKALHTLLGALCFLGPGYQRCHKVRPGHVVATLTLLCAVILYILAMPVSAPVTLPVASFCVGIFSTILALAVMFFLLIPAIRDFRNRKESFRVRFLPIVVSFVLFLVFLLGSMHLRFPRAFPVIAYVAILLIVVFWTMAGIAFFADHFRIPVLTLAISAILLINAFPAEHVFPVRPLNPTEVVANLPTPAYYVQHLAYDTSGNPQPVIIITATGGGIHAAAWTATVLGELEKSFGPKFHRHILLISSVSGGSVAAMAFLHEYFADRPFDPEGHFRQRVLQSSECSSLQAVAWGLAYPDALRTLFPWFYNLFSSLDRFDRGWALEMAFQRNLNDEACFQDKSDLQAAFPDPSSFRLNSLAMLLQTLPAGAAPEDPRAHFPAFTFNTTVVETGDRFLLSNYSAFSERVGREQILPAASFLGVYGREALLHPPVTGRGGYADISLFTAARLSASFTYVSPPARLPFEMSQGKAQNAYHFVDGGYYDNDGTNSVIEFLRSAKDALPKNRVLPVLLIEIRNSDDIDDTDSPDSYAHQANLVFQPYAPGDPRQPGSPLDGAWKAPRKAPGRWGPIAQLLAPPEAAIHSGFNSTTRRNRRELDLLECAFDSQLSINHVVLGYQQHISYKKGHEAHTAAPQIDTGESEVDQPLSWHLTKRQKLWISGNEKNSNGQPIIGALDRNTNPSDRQKIKEALDWFDNPRANGALTGGCVDTVAPQDAP